MRIDSSKTLIFRFEVTAVEKLIQQWKDGDGGNILLHDYIGVTEEEFADFMMDGSLPLRRPSLSQRVSPDMYLLPARRVPQ